MSEIGGGSETDPFHVSGFAFSSPAPSVYSGLPTLLQATTGTSSTTAKIVKQDTGLSVGMGGFGTKAHTQLKREIDAMGGGLRGEVSYLDGAEVNYGTEESVRFDVLKGRENQPEAIWDLKTDTAKLTKERIDEMRSHLPEEYKNVPIAEVRIPGSN